MQRTDSTGKAKSTRRKIESSTTLNRRYIKRPKQSMDMVTTVSVRRSPKIKKFNSYGDNEHVSASESSVGEMSVMAPEIVDTMQPDEMYGAMSPEEMIDSGMSVEMFNPVDPQEIVDSASSEELYNSASSEEISSVQQDGMYNTALGGVYNTTPEEMLDQDVQGEMGETEMATEMGSSQINRYYGLEMQEEPVVQEEPNVEEAEEYAEPHPLQKVANTRMQARKKATTKKTARPSAKELKEQAIKQALAAASMTTRSESQSKKHKKKSMSLLSVGLGRVTLAFACAALAVFAIVYFVNVNMPDISLKVAAMQTGINASYPSYVPREYSISSITSENKKITLSFKNGQTDEKFSIVEEISSWDSNALLSNYVKPTYDENYTTVKEQGLTIYISGSNAVWVNGGVMYKISADGDNLTNKQIRSIATSL